MRRLWIALAAALLVATPVWSAVELDGDDNGAVDVDKGGTNGTTAAAARTALGLAIGANVQAYDADLDDLADGSLSGSKVDIAATDLPATGSWDASGLTITLGPIALLQGTNPTVDAAGEPAVDTTADQFLYYGAAVRALTYVQRESFVVKSPADADDFPLLKAPFPLTLTQLDCIVDPAGTGESVTVAIYECDGTGDNCADGALGVTADNDGAVDNTITDAAIDSGDWLQVVLGAPTGTVSFLSCTLQYTVTRQ